MKKLMLVLALMLGGCWNTGTASLKGYVIKMDGQGVIWPTMEAKMMEGSLNSGHMSQEINVPGHLIRAFEEAQTSGKLVLVKYHGELVVAPWRAATNKIADSIEVVE